MAQRVITQLVDDLTGEDIAEGKGETVSFALDGHQYLIDLTTKNADKFRGLFQDYIAAGSKVGRRTGARGGRSQAGPSAKELRDWARSQGLDVPDRGRIPASVREAFESAQ
jgi:hypothetical protein